MDNMPFIPRTRNVVIGGVTYMIGEMLASERNIFLFESANIMGEAFTLMIENYFADTQKLEELGVSIVLRGINRKENNDPVKLNAFIKSTILKCVKSPKAASVEAEYEMHFTQHYTHITELLNEIYKLNFGETIQNLKKKLQTSGIFTPKSSKSKLNESEIVLKEEPPKSSLSTNF